MRRTVSSGGAASRRRHASPSICSPRQPSKLQCHPPEIAPFDAPGERSALGVNGVARSPDGRSTAFTALGDLWLAERGEPRRLTNDEFVDLDPTFWPDGESLVFASERTGQFELWRLTLRDGKLVQLTFGALEPRRPAVRPDGNSIAYLESTSLEPRAATVLKTLDWRRREDTTIATNVVGATALAWSEDGRALAVQASAADAVNPRDFRVDVRTQPPASETPAAARPQLRWQVPAPPRDYVVEIGRLFDGVRATYHRHVDLHVRGGRIAAIVPRGVLPPSGEVIDARDATVIPGLIDVHAHLSSLVGERLGRAWLAYGVTTVRELTTTPAEAIERAEMWASGRSPGPRLVISATRPGSDDAGAAVRAYPGIAQGFAHSLRRQVGEIAVPPWAPTSFPARLPTELGAPSRELELSPGFTAYQDGFSRLIASDTTFVTGLAALAGLQGWPSPRPRADGAFGALFTPTEQAAWERPDALAAALPALERTIARLLRAGGRVAVGSDAPAVPMVSASTSSSRGWPMRASPTTRSCAWQRPKARWHSVSSSRSARSRKASSPTSSSWTAIRWRTSGIRCGSSPWHRAEFGVSKPLSWRRGDVRRLYDPSSDAVSARSHDPNFARPCETAGYLRLLIQHASSDV